MKRERNKIMKTKFDELTGDLKRISEDAFLYWQYVAMAYEGYVKVFECPKESAEYVNAIVQEEYNFIRHVEY